MAKFVQKENMYHIMSEKLLVECCLVLSEDKNDFKWPRWRLEGEVLVDFFHFLYPSFISLIETISLILLFIFVLLILEVGKIYLL